MLYESIELEDKTGHPFTKAPFFGVSNAAALAELPRRTRAGSMRRRPNPSRSRNARWKDDSERLSTSSASPRAAAAATATAAAVGLRR